MSRYVAERGAISIYFVQGEMAFRFILLLTIVRPPGSVKKQDMFWKQPVAGRQTAGIASTVQKSLEKMRHFCNITNDGLSNTPVNLQHENNDTDQHLVGLVLGGDTLAFGSIIKNTERLVAQIVFKMIKNEEDRKDIAQDIYLKAYKNIPGFRFQSKLSTWIARIAYNTCLSYLEKKKLLLPGDFESLNNHATDTTDWVLPAKESSTIIQKAIERLPALLKTLLTLYHNEDMSYAEIQQITSLPEGTIKSYLFRARKALKEDLLLHYKKEEL